MTNMQLELVGARECGFNVRSWAAAIDEIDRVTDWSVIKVPDPNDVIGQVCDQYHVKVRVGEAAVVWMRSATVNHDDSFDPYKPLISAKYLEQGGDDE